ncbi:MAG: hypothetical protein V4662_04325 [Verrucomicrobiota bacterium]
MNRNRATVLFVGVLVCAPLLALYHFGIFPEAAKWLSVRLPGLLVLPVATLKLSLPLQYALYTALAFSSAWLGMEMEAAWKKYLYLLGLSFLILLLTPVLALNGMLFEPFSGILAASFAMLIGVMLGDRSESTPAPEPVPVVQDSKSA